MATMYYINLTNGIEALPVLFDKPVRFIRIQSTACEQKLWNKIILDLDYDFLLNLAIGNEIIVYDYGQKGVPRALWQGVVWIEYVTNRYWLNKTIDPVVRGGHHCGEYFNGAFARLSPEVKLKLDYFKKFIHTEFTTGANKFKIIPIGCQTIHDNDHAFYRQTLLVDQLGREI